MIIIIACLVSILLGSIGLILYYKKIIENEWMLFSYGFLFVGIIIGTVSGAISLSDNLPQSCKEARIEYEAKVIELQNTYSYLVKLDDDKDKYTAIQQYNLEVKEFKTEIIKKQSRLKNPWINWLQCKEYKYFDANVVSYIGASYEIH